MTPRHDERNRMTKLQTVILAITCFVLAGIAYKFIPSAEIVAAGLGGIGMWLFGLAQRHPVDKAKLTQAASRDDKTVPPVVLLALIVGMLAIAAPARAAEWQTVSPGVYKSGSWVAHPNFAISAGQVNVKEALDSGMFSGRAIERVALAGGYGLTYHGEKLTMGAGLYFGTGISAKTPNAPQVNLLFTLWDALATGPGVQRVTFASGTVAWQMLWTVGLNYAAGGTVSKVTPWFDKVINACVAGAACAL